MPILIVGVLAGAFLHHAWHKEVHRQAQQEARLHELHHKMAAHLEKVQAVHADQKKA